jgi:hypothetical protein
MPKKYKANKETIEMAQTRRKKSKPIVATGPVGQDQIIYDKPKSKTAQERENFMKAQERFAPGKALDLKTLVKVQVMLREAKSHHRVAPNMKLENALHYLELDLIEAQREVAILKDCIGTIRAAMDKRARRKADKAAEMIEAKGSKKTKRTKKEKK